jgi:hypothetical protein
VDCPMPRYLAYSAWDRPPLRSRTISMMSTVAPTKILMLLYQNVDRMSTPKRGYFGMNLSKL